MTQRLRTERWVRAALATLFFAAVAAPAAVQAQTGGTTRTSARRTARPTARPADGVVSLRVLGGSTRFVLPVRSVEALRISMSRPRIQRDVATLLDEAGLGSVKAEVLRILAEGQVAATSAAPGTTMEWMAMRRAGQARLSRNVRWDGSLPLEGFEFRVSDETSTYVFFVPQACGNVSLVRREVKPPVTISETPRVPVIPVPPVRPEPPVARVPDPPREEPKVTQNVQKPCVGGPITGAARSVAGRPLSKLTVEALDPRGAVTSKAVTARDGAFSLSNTQCGEYLVRCVSDGGKVLGTSNVSVTETVPSVYVTCQGEPAFFLLGKKTLLGLAAAAVGVTSGALVASGNDASPSR